LGANPSVAPREVRAAERGERKGSSVGLPRSTPLELGQLLWSLIAAAGNPLQVRDARGSLVASVEEPEREAWERHELEEIQRARLDATEREALVKARVGQGVFRANVARVEPECRITKVSNPAYLIASHIKPWRHASNEERLSAHNGLLLAPHADFLFDRGFISFGDGRLLISQSLTKGHS